MHKKMTAATTALVAAVALALTGCSSSGNQGTSTTATDGTKCGPLSAMTNATVATNPGAQDLVIKTVKAQGFDTKYDLNLDVKSFQNPPATAQAITQHAVDFGFGGLTTMVQARAGGADVQMIGALVTPGSGVFVPKDSPITNLGDLKGKRVGSFTALNGAITSVVQALAQKEYGVNLLTQVDGKIHVAPDAELYGLMDQGQLDAIILDVDGTAYQQQAGNYKQILDLTTDFKSAMGFDALYLGPVTTEQYSSQNCSAVRAYVSAIHDAIGYIEQNSSVWATYAQSVGHPEAAQAYQDLYNKSWVTDWTQTQVDGMKQLVTTLTPYLDPSFPKEIPDGLFSLDYPVISK